LQSASGSAPASSSIVAICGALAGERCRSSSTPFAET
jgi:hypothetical protein